MKTNQRAKSSSSSPEPRSQNTPNTSTSTAFKAGTVCLAFLILGYQVCLFIQKSAVLGIAAVRERPDTVVVYLAAEAPAETLKVEQRPSSHQTEIPTAARRHVESFSFDPNTVSVAELQRLGFSEKQAASIDAYRMKGGRFRRKEDFARSYVVADSVYRRLEPFIRIPKVDINSADSAAFDALPGIGGYYASKMVEYRERLGGYSCTQQLMEIYRFDEQKYAALEDLIECVPVGDPFALWTLSEDELRRHPHIRTYSVAHAIVLYRSNTPKEDWTLEGLRDAGILDESRYEGLKRCRIEEK